MALIMATCTLMLQLVATAVTVVQHSAFISSHVVFGNKGRSLISSFSRQQSRRMVRNIDLCEALIFYGEESIVYKSDTADNESMIKMQEKDLIPGIEHLIQECERDETAVLGILPENSKLSSSPAVERITCCTSTKPPPNPRDLLLVINSIVIQPKGFGGSSGFGSKAADPERSPMPQHCVVFCHSIDQCRAARYAGMRAVCLKNNDLADAVMFGETWEEIASMDDIATPGSFWLNPPHPRDDESNAVDPEEVMIAYEEGEWSVDASPAENQIEADSDEESEEEMSDDELAAILADMDTI